jgi:hypothetical protein
LHRSQQAQRGGGCGDATLQDPGLARLRNSQASTLAVGREGEPAASTVGRRARANAGLRPNPARARAA